MAKSETSLQHYVPVETQSLIKGFTVCMASFDLLLLTLEKCSGSLTPLDHLTFETLHLLNPSSFVLFISCPQRPTLEFCCCSKLLSIQIQPQPLPLTPSHSSLWYISVSPSSHLWNPIKPLNPTCKRLVWVCQASNFIGLHWFPRITNPVSLDWPMDWGITWANPSVVHPYFPRFV